MHTSRLTITFVAALFFPLMSTARAQVILTAETQAVLDANSDLRFVARGERLVALYGVPFTSDGDPATTTDQFVDTWLFDPLTGQKDALGVDNVVLVLKDKVNIRNNKFSVYTYTQQIEGLPVHGSLVRIPVLLGATEKISYVGMRLVQHPASPLPADALTAQDASNVVAQSATYGHLTTFTAPEKVIFEADDKTLHRAWRFSGYDADESYLFFVDTKAPLPGEIVGAMDQVFEGNVSGTVTGFSTPCLPSEDLTCPNCCPADNPLKPESCPQEMDMRGIEVGIIGEPTQYAETNGFYEFTGLLDGQPVSVQTLLTGQWVTVKNLDGMDSIIESTVTPPEENVNFVFNPTEPACRDAANNPAWPPEFDTAQVNAFLAVQKTHDWFKDLSGSPLFDLQLLAEVNASGLCNARFFLVPQKIQFFRSSASCNNSAFSTIISHEYGHFIVNQRIPFFGGLAARSFHEAAADTVAALLWDTELLGLDFRKDDLPIRNIDVPDVRLNDCSSLPASCNICGGFGHCPGLALGGAFWDLRKTLLKCAGGTNPGASCNGHGDCFGGGLCTDDLATEELFADFLFITDGFLDRSAVVEVLIADDDNADLMDGTPNQGAILQSFVDLHGWCNPIPDPIGDGSVKVSWLGPTTGPPELGVDHRVFHYVGCPPDVTFITTEKDLPVVRWLVGRVDPQTGQPLDLGTVSARWDGPAHDIRVNVGSETDPSLKCRSVERVAIPRQGENNWSNIQLNLTGDVSDILRAFPATDGTGGRISGTIAGSVELVIAKAIGLESSQPGTLEIGGSLNKEIALETMPTGSTLSVSRVPALSFVIVFEDLDGTIQILNDLVGVVLIRGREVSRGDILVNGSIGDVTGGVVIEGDMEGNIHADADQNGFGVIERITVLGVFNGDICGSNLVPGGALTSNMSIVFGPNGTVCEQTPCPTIDDLTSHRDRLLFVDADATLGMNNGRSWADAFTDLTNAIAQAAAFSQALGQAYEIWVAGGTYRPSFRTDPLDPRTATFPLVNRILLYGGFAGVETKRCDRSLTTNETILSGDLNGDDLPGFINNAENSYHVVFGSNLVTGSTNATALLDGFTITGGNANGAFPDNTGAGMYNDAGSPTVSNCTFRDNFAGLAGGGINNRNGSSPTVTNCVFTGNTSTFGFGGAISYHSLGDVANLTDCTFVENSAGDGGALELGSLSSGHTVTSCIFDSNVASFIGGGIRSTADDLTLTNCTFHGNTADIGGGMFNAGLAKLTNCTFSANTAQTNYGGGICFASSTATLVNCTFRANAAPLASGGGIANLSSAATVTNCILWSNADSGGMGSSAQIFNDATSTTVVTFSDVQGGFAGAGNIDVDPQFVDADGPDNIVGTVDDNLRLFASSPCIEAGNNAAVPPSVSTDLDGNPRIFDADGDEEAPGQFATVDMGAYEFPCPSVDPPTVPTGEAGFDKHRVISFVPQNLGEQTAIRVTHTMTGFQYWVGPPADVTENSSNVNPIQGWPNFKASQLQCGSFYTDWGAFGETIHVYGPEVVPSAAYDVQVIHVGCDETDESLFSAPLTVETSKWGDIVALLGCPYPTAPEGEVNLTDVIAVLDKFSNADCAVIKARADTEPELLDMVINISDVLQVNSAFSGVPYPFSSPQACP